MVRMDMRDQLTKAFLELIFKLKNADPQTLPVLAEFRARPCKSGEPMEGSIEEAWIVRFRRRRRLLTTNG